MFFVVVSRKKHCRTNCCSFTCSIKATKLLDNRARCSRLICNNVWKTLNRNCYFTASTFAHIFRNCSILFALHPLSSFWLNRSCKHTVTLTVCQPHTNNATRKSAILTAAKKAKLKSNPSRVRFAEGVVINGSPLCPSSPFDTCVPYIPNVLKGTIFVSNEHCYTRV